LVIYFISWKIPLYKIDAMIKAVIFDMAGTTVRDNHEVELCFSEACKATGLVASDEKILAIQGWSKKYVFEVLWKEQIGEQDPTLEDKVEESFQTFKKILENYYLMHPIVPTDGALEVFDFCRKNSIKIVLTTGFYRGVTNIILEKLGWEKGLNDEYMALNGSSVIDLSITSDEVTNGRPWPDMVHKAMRMLNIEDPKELIVVGDTPSDLGIGKNSGALLTIGLTNGTHTKAQLEKYAHDLLLDSVKELPAVIQKINQN
jgi:phosphonatase-like hydrolase